MAFASERVGSAGAGPRDTSSPAGLTSFLQLGAGAPHGSHEPRAQGLSVRFPTARALSVKPGDAPGSKSTEALRRFNPFAAIRRTIYTPTDPQSTSGVFGQNTGQGNDWQNDPEGRGMVRGVHGEAVGDRNVGDIVNAMEFTIQQSPEQSEAGAPMGPDLSTQHSDPINNDFSSTLVARSSFPGIKISPIPEAECRILTVISTPVEFNIPTAAVLMRVTWSAMNAGQDLMISFDGGALATFNAAGNNSPATYRGLILNPDPNSFYLVRNKRAFSCMVPISGVAFVNPTIVSAQFYKQAS